MEDIIKALETNNTEKVLQCISDNKDMENIKAEKRYELLHFAIKKSCSAEIINCLLTSDININSANSLKDKNPLELLIDSNGDMYNKNEYLNILGSLMNKGAIVDNKLINIAEKKIESDIEIIRTLCEIIIGGNNKRNEVLTYIQGKVKSKPFNQLEYPNIRDKNGNTLLHSAIESKNMVAFKSLLTQAKIDINLINKDGDTPLHCAIKSKNIDALDILLDQAKTDINFINKDGDTPLHCAIKSKNIDALDILLDQAKTDINLINKNGDTPLHCAIKFENIYALEMLLIQAKIDVNLINKDGDTPLHCAIKLKNACAFNGLLTQTKIDINLTNKDGQTPLEFASASNAGAKFTRPLKRMEKQEIKNDINEVIKKLDITKDLFRKTTQQQPLLFSFSACQEMLQSNENDKETMKMILSFLKETVADHENNTCFYEEKRIEDEEVQTSKAKLEQILLNIKREQRLIKQEIDALENKKEPDESLEKLQGRVNDIEEIIKPLNRAMEIQNEISQWLQSNDNLQGKELMIFYFTMLNRLKEFYIALSAIRGGAARSKSWKDNVGAATFTTLGILASAALAGATFGVGAVAAPVLIGGSLMIGESLYGSFRENKKKNDHNRGLDNMRDPKIGKKLLGAGYMPDGFYVDLSNKLLSISAAKLMQQQIKCCTQDGVRKLAVAFVDGIKYSIIKEAGLPDDERSLLLFKKDSKGTLRVPLPTKLDSFPNLVRNSNKEKFSRHEDHYWQTKHAVHHPGICCKTENGMEYYSCDKLDAEKYGYRTLPSKEALNNYKILLLRSKFKFCIKKVEEENEKTYILNNIKRAAVKWLCVYSGSKRWELYKIKKSNSNKHCSSDFIKDKTQDCFDNNYSNNLKVISHLINSCGTDKEKEKLKNMKWHIDNKPIGPPIYKDYELTSKKSDSPGSTSSVEALRENSQDFKTDPECAEARYKPDEKLSIALSTRKQVKIISEESKRNKDNIEALQRQLAEEKTRRIEAEGIAEKNQKDVERLNEELKQERAEREKDINEMKEDMRQLVNVTKKLLPGTESAADTIARNSSLFSTTGLTPIHDEENLQNDEKKSPFRSKHG